MNLREFLKTGRISPATLIQIVRYTGQNGDRYKSERGPFSQVKSPKFGRDRKSVHKFQEAPDAKLRLNALGKVKPGWVPKTPADKEFIQRVARLQEP